MYDEFEKGAGQWVSFLRKMLSECWKIQENTKKEWILCEANLLDIGQIDNGAPVQGIVWNKPQWL